MSATADDTCAALLGLRLQQASRRTLAEDWLNRLVGLVPVEARAVFPSELILDHIPSLIDEVGKYVANPAGEDIAARAFVLAKARELGELRHQQQASIHQVLREYDLLGEVLEEFVIGETRALLPQPALSECLHAWQRVGRAVRVMMQITAGTFITEYTETVTEQGRRLDRFNRAVSHELRNVLGTLQFGASLLMRETLEDAQRGHVQAVVHRGVDRAVKILRNLERLPRSGILADSPTEQTADVTEVIHEVFRQLQEMADNRGVALRMEASPTLIHLDTGALELVFINLVANAIKYSDEQKADKFVTIEFSPSAEYYEFRVRDNGIGIPASDVSRIFERFVRAHAHLDGQLGIEGTGLGLALVDECVKVLSGEINVASDEYIGTTFVLRIPKKLPPLRAS